MPRCQGGRGRGGPDHHGRVWEPDAALLATSAASVSVAGASCARATTSYVPAVVPLFVGSIRVADDV